MSWRLTRAGLHSGPRMLKNVRTPSDRRTGPTWRSAGWNWGANRNAMPASCRHGWTPSASRSARTPSADSTSAEPLDDEHALVAVLGDGHARAGGHEAGRRRDVERARVVAAGAAQVDRVEVAGLDRDRVLAHHLREADQLVDRLAARAEPHQQPAIWAGSASPESITCIADSAWGWVSVSPSAMAWRMGRREFEVGRVEGEKVAASEGRARARAIVRERIGAPSFRLPDGRGRRGIGRRRSR